MPENSPYGGAMRSTWQGAESVLRLNQPHPQGDPPGKVAALLASPWNLLDDGTNVWAFQSPGSPYVLKLFKTPAAMAEAMAFWGDEMPAEESTRLAHAHGQVRRELRGAALAWRRARQETGLIWADPTGGVRLTTQVAGETFPMSGVPFLVQERAVPLRESLAELAKKGEPDARVFALLEELVELIVGLMRRGLADTDCYFRGNFGTASGRLIQIDTGGLVPGYDAVRNELSRRRIVTHPTFARLQTEQPSWANHLAALVDRDFSALQHRLARADRPAGEPETSNSTLASRRSAPSADPGQVT